MHFIFDSRFKNVDILYSAHDVFLEGWCLLSINVPVCKMS